MTNKDRTTKDKKIRDTSHWIDMTNKPRRPWIAAVLPLRE